ncbi:MAG: mono/diheme cytochrome c family protein [Verrucomicrobiales bacterium]|jgi:mono/diheme cytochrome c family protein
MIRALLIFLLMTALPAAAEESPSDGETLFALKIWPLLSGKCLACHGNEPEKIKGGLDLRTLDSTLAGGETFGREVLIPGKGEASFLYITVTRNEADFEMPPKLADQLSEDERESIRSWIDAGAPWPDTDRIGWIVENFGEGTRIATSGGLSEDWTNRRYKSEDVWAYQPVRQPAIPDSWSLSPIDYFIDPKIEESGVKPAPRADARTLIRRATFDLLGLPPKPEDVDRFVAADAEDPEKAWAKLIDELLSSPHYGEQWGRHWLDVVRYADSAGFANDYERPNTWRYRDYVIRSLNADKPYDQFIREQIAGDELKPGDTEMLIATGFLRMGPWEHTGMSVAKVTRQQWLDDVTDTVGQVFLAHALQCARCHDHKFDPVPTRDFYAIQACFATTQFAEIETEWLPEENRNGMAEDKRLQQRRTQANQQLLAALNQKTADEERKWFKERGLPWLSRKEAIDAEAPQDEIPQRRVGLAANDFGQERIARKWANRFSWEMDRYKPIAFTVYNGGTRTPESNYGRVEMPNDPLAAGELEKTAILGGGDVFSPTEPVAPGLLSAVPGALDFEIPTTPEGRRLALAEWIASPENTLTARVIVNRIWFHHFGRGIAGNPSSFGATGKKPTHPELLDWLATEFVESGWSLKALHRQIMISAAYQRASAGESGLYEAFQPRRLSAEELRDSMLAISGELNFELGGIPARPDMNLEAALQPRMIMGSFAPSYVPNPKPEQRNRRTIYAHKTRGQRDPFLEVFNQPGPDKSCEIRDNSNVTPQVFAMFNSEESADRALAFAARLLAEREGDENAAVKRAFELVYGRPAAAEEIEAGLVHWKLMIEEQESLFPERREFPIEVTRSANEENTGEIFEFKERLFAYEIYKPDLQSIDADPRTRGLADLCLVLLNSNEFVYVY